MGHRPKTWSRPKLWSGMGLHVFLAAGTYVFAKPAATGFADPGALTLARALIAAVVLLALCGSVIPWPRFGWRDWCQIAGLGFLLVPVNQYTFLVGMRHTSPGHPALLYSLTPLGVLLLGALWSRRLPPRRKSLGVGLAFAGVLILLRPWDDSALARDLRTGDLWIGAAVAAWVLYTLVARPICRRHDTAVVTAWSLICGAGMMLPWSLGPLLQEDLGALGLDAWVGLFWLAAFTSVVMMLLWNKLLQQLEAVEVAICANAQPPTTVLLSLAAVAWGLQVGEPDIGPVFWAGMACVLGGVAIVQSSSSLASPNPKT